MPGSLLEGYLGAQQHEQQQEELAEEKKRKKLEEALNQLKLKEFGRQMDRDVEEFRYQQRKRGELDEALSSLRLRGIDVDALLTGYEAPKPPYKWMGTRYEEPGARKEFHIKPEKPAYPWMGTSYEKAGARKQFYITPQRKYGVIPSGMQWIIDEKTGKRKLVPKPEREEDVLDITRAMKTLFPTSPSFEEFGEPVTTADSLWKGLITEPRTPGEEAFFAGRKGLESALADPTETKMRQIDLWRSQGYSKEEIKAAIDAEKDRLSADGVKLQELYDYLGL